MKVWMVQVTQNDGGGDGTRPDRYRFAEFDDACRFYRALKDWLATSPAWPPMVEEPRPLNIMPPQVIAKGGWPKGWEEILK